MDILENRLEAIFSLLDTSYGGGEGMSSASKGSEREIFIDNVLGNILPPHYRFSSGDIIDTYRNQTGQVDIVLEQSRSYSFPLAKGAPRLFLAESVAAVIEVKSNIKSQWKEVISTSEKVATIRRSYLADSYSEILQNIQSGRVHMGPGVTRQSVEPSLRAMINDPKNNGKPRIYYFVVGFSGWEKDETIASKLIPNQIDGILQIDRRVYATKLGRADGKEVVQGAQSLLSFLHWLEVAFSEVPERSPASSAYF